MRESTEMADPRINRVVVEESAHPLAPATPTSVRARREALAEEYSHYEATAPIDEPDTGARMFNPGDRVPKSHVERFGDLFEGRVRSLSDDDTADDDTAEGGKATKGATKGAATSKREG